MTLVRQCRAGSLVPVAGLRPTRAEGALCVCTRDSSGLMSRVDVALHALTAVLPMLLVAAAVLV